MANNDLQILKSLVTAGARSYGANEAQAIELLEKHLAKDVPSNNKPLFYKLVGALQQPDSVKYTPQRAIKLKQRLKTFEEADLIKAANGIAQDEWLMGDNPGGKKYGNIDYLLRNDEQIDTILANTGGGEKHIDLKSLEF